MNPPRIEVQVDELAVHGFEPGRARRLAEALEQELGRLLSAETSSDWQEREIGALDAGALPVDPGASSNVVGARVARAVFWSLTSGGASL